MPNSPKILVLDSGAGCLSIAKEIAQRHSHVDITCFADIAAFPYGKRSDETLIARQTKLVSYLLPRVEPDILVLACNTASTVALDSLRNKFKPPIIGVVPAIKPAVKLTCSGAIGVLATPATVDSNYTQSLIRQFAGDTEVHLHGSSELVALAEHYLTDENIDRNILTGEVDKLLEKSTKPIDVIVLACTHFPLIKPALAEINRYTSIRWVDSGQAIAQRVSHWLRELGLPETGKQSTKTEIRFSQATNKMKTEAYRQHIEKNFPNHSSKNISIKMDEI